MRYAIISDLHANLPAWERVLADIRGQGVEEIVCLGDVVGYGPNPSEVLRGVRGATRNFVLGNHDAAAAGIMDYSIFNDHARQAIEWTMGKLNAEAKTFLSAVPLAIEAGDVLLCMLKLPCRVVFTTSMIPKWRGKISRWEIIL